MPAGMVIFSFFLLVIYPVPRQSGHFSRITLPVPPQSGQVWTFCTVPNMDCWVYMILPLPLHLEQVSGEVPAFAPVP